MDNPEHIPWWQRLSSEAQIEEKFARAARLLEPHVGIAPVAELRERALKHYFANFRWKCDTRKLVNEAAATLGPDHAGLAIITGLLDEPWPIFMDESPDDPEEGDLGDDDLPEPAMDEADDQTPDLFPRH